MPIATPAAAETDFLLQDAGGVVTYGNQSGYGILESPDLDKVDQTQFRMRGYARILVVREGAFTGLAEDQAINVAGVAYLIRDVGTAGATGLRRMAVTRATPVDHVTASPAPAYFNIGDTITFSAIVYDINNNVLTGRSVSWSSSAPSVISINATTGVATALSSGVATITATAEGKTFTILATAALPLSLTLDFNPLVRPYDLADPLILVSNTGRTGYQDAVPQHLGSGLLGVTPRASYPKSADAWGFVAPVDGPMSSSYIPGAHNGTSVVGDGPYPNTAAYTITPSGASTAHFTALDDRWQALPSADNQDGSGFKRSLACALIAATPADVGKVVRVNLLDNSNYPAGDWTGANVIAFQDVTLLHSLAEIDHTSATADLWQHVSITFPDSATQSATPNPQLFISIPGASLVNYAVAPYMARAWQDESDPDVANWLRPLPFHRTLGLLSTDIYCNCWPEDCDLPTLYGGASRASTAIAAPDSGRFFGGRTLSQYTLGVGDGITTTALTRIEDGGSTPPSLSNTPTTRAWVHWYLEPAAGHALPLDTDLVAYLAASGTGTLAEDTVQRADNLTSPGSMDTGQAWLIGSGVWGVFGNTLQLQTQVAEDFIYVDCGTGDGTWVATLFAVGNDGSLEFRIADANNRWRLLWEAGVVYLQKNVAGAGFSTVASTAVTLNALDTLGVVLSGNTITPQHNGTTIAALVATDAFNATATKYGVGALNNGPRFSHVKMTGTGALKTYGPVPLTRDDTRYGNGAGTSPLVRANGGQFFRAPFNINQASEGYLDFRPRIVNASGGQLVFNAYRAAVTTEGTRGEGLHSAWVPKRTITGRQFGDSCFEIFPNIQKFLTTPTLLWVVRNVLPWSFGDLENLNGAGVNGYHPSLWQSGPYGSADYTFHCDVQPFYDGTLTMDITVARGSPTPDPQDFMSWQIVFNRMSIAQLATTFPKMVAFDIAVAAQNGAPQLVGIGTGTGTGMQWITNGATFCGGTVSYSSTTGLAWTFDGGNYNDCGHMGLAADLDRVRQTNGWIQAIAAGNVFDDTVAGLQTRILVHIARNWGARKDYR